MATTNVNNTTQTAPEAAQKIATNPKAKLDSQDFMKLLLTQLRYQDPTAPMDSEKMLSQTSQLATLETQESTNKIMKELAEQLKKQSSSGMNSYALSAIGKIATIGEVSLAITNDSSTAKFDLFFPEEIKKGKISITNQDGEVIKTIDLKQGEQGVLSFLWDGKNSDNQQVSNGSYKVVATYTDKDGQEHTVKPGTYPVESVKNEDGQAMLKLGSTYVPLKDVKEFFKG